ncbi:hypothetical protein Tco_0959083 [Tanacetum coccineum]
MEEIHGGPLAHLEKKRTRYGSTPSIFLKNCAYRAWRRRRRLQATASGFSSKSWNDPRDFAKPVKAISLPQDVPSTSDCRLIELENQVQHLMGAHLAPKKLIQVNKITSSCEICSGPHDTQYCMENPEQAFVNYASSCIDKAGDEAKEEGSVKSSTTENNDHEMTVESEEEF